MAFDNCELLATITNTDCPTAPKAEDAAQEQRLGMLTTDIALKLDKDYREIVEEFAIDEGKFKKVFAAAWYKLTTRDMGPRLASTALNV